MLYFVGDSECHTHPFKILFPLLKIIHCLSDGEKETLMHSISLPLLFRFFSFVPSGTLEEAGHLMISPRTPESVKR
jgi:hypothetical protein